MIGAREELSHLADTLSEAEAERVLAVIQEHMPELYDEARHHRVRRADGTVGTMTFTTD